LVHGSIVDAVISVFDVDAVVRANWNYSAGFEPGVDAAVLIPIAVSVSVSVSVAILSRAK